MKLSLAAQCILGLVLGIVAGIAASQLHPAALDPWLDGGSALIQVWTNALRMLVVPLVVSQLFVALSRRIGGSESASLGLAIPTVFLGLFLVTSASSILIASSLLRLPIFSGLSLSGAAVPAVAQAAGAGPFQWLVDMVPPNVLAAASTNAILPVILFTFAFAMASRRLAPPLRQSLENVAEAVRETMFVLVSWLMRVAPPILFVLGFRSAERFGFDVGSALLAYLAIWAVVITAGILILYPTTWLVGGLSIPRFAKALFPAQMAAVASRSSVATVPILLKDSESQLKIPTRLSSLVIPTGAAMLKLSQAASPLVRLLFLASLLGIPLQPQQVLVFLLTIIVLSPGVVGIPRFVSSSGRSLPAYIAAGIPPEYVLILGPLNAIMDPLLTALNTSGYMAANVLVARRVLGKAGLRAASAGPAAAASMMAEPSPSLPATPKLN